MNRSGSVCFILLSLALAVAAQEVANDNNAPAEQAPAEQAPVQDAVETPRDEVAHKMGMGSLANWRIHAASTALIFMFFLFFIFAGTNIPEKVCGLRSREYLFSARLRLLGKKKGYELPKEEDSEAPNEDESTSQPTKPVMKRILGANNTFVEEKTPLMPTPVEQRRQQVPLYMSSHSVFENPVHKYGGLDAALEAFNPVPAAPERKSAWSGLPMWAPAPAPAPAAPIIPPAPEPKQKKSMARASARLSLAGLYDKKASPFTG